MSNREYRRTYRPREVALKLYIQAFVTVLSLINPAVCGMIFSKVEASRSRTQRMADATKAGVAIFVILELAALFGVRILELFGISLDVFSVAGGGVLVWMGFSMLRGSTAGPGGESSLTPLILFAASPGTISGVITLAVSHSRSDLPITAIVAVAAATLMTWIVMTLLSLKDGKATGGGFVQATVQSFMGLIVMAMGVQFGVEGLGNIVKSGGI